MASTNKTQKYLLSQFLSNDKPAWLTDYNADMLKIDNGLSDVDKKATANEVAIASLGNDVETNTSAITNLSVASSQHGADITDLKAQDIIMNNKITNLENKKLFNLLWANQNPTQSFTPQVLAIDYTNYNFIAIESLLNTDGTISIFDIIPVGNISTYRLTGLMGVGIVMRDLKSLNTKTQIEIGRGYLFARNMQDEERNDTVIPYKIYGVNM